MDINATEKKKELRERREHLAQALNTIKREYDSKSYGESLRIVGPLLDALATATAAQVIKNGSSSLLISLRIALQGIESEKSKGGIIGKVLSSATKGVIDLVIGTYLTKEDVGSKQLLQLISQALILATISATWKLEQFNFSNGPVSGLEGKRKQLFGFELVLLLILRSGMIELIAKSIAEACGAHNQQQESIAKLMKALILILTLLTAAKGSQATLKTLTLDLKDYLIEGLIDIQNFINNAAEAGKTGEQASAISIFVQQAIASLYEEDFDTLQQAYTETLQTIQANPEQMDADIAEITKFAEIIYNAFTQGSLDLTRMTTSLMI